MQVFNRLKVLADIPYYSVRNVGKIGDFTVMINSKITLTDSVKNEFNLDIKIFLGTSMLHKVSWDFNCKSLAEANAKAAKVTDKIESIMKKFLISSFNNSAIKAINSIKL